MILPDNDDPGRTYANIVADILSLLNPPATVRILQLRDLPEHGDIVDFIEARDSRDDDDLRWMIEAIAEETPTCQPCVSDATTPSLQGTPFPTEVLPEPIRSFVTKGAKAIGCDASMIALPTLAAVASVIGTTRRIRLKQTWAEPSVLWTAIVGYSGTLKSPAQEYALRPLMRLQADRFREFTEAMTAYELDRLRYDRDVAQWKRDKAGGDPPAKPDEPQAVRLVCADATIEALAAVLESNPRGILLARDELAGWLGSFDQYRAGNGGNSAAWLELHRAGPLIVDRKTGKRITNVSRAAVSVCGTIQPETLQRALGFEHFQDGLAARLLLAMPPRRRKRWTDDDVPQHTVDAFQSLIERLRDLHHNIDKNGESVPVDIPLSEAGRGAWVSFYNEHARRQHDTHDRDLAAAFSKLEGYAARIALLHHFTRWAASPDFDGDTIGPESVEAGAALARWFCHEAERLYCTLAESDDDRERRDLTDFIRSRGGSMTVNELRRGPRRFRDDAGTARDELQALVTSGVGRWEHKIGPKGGRPAERFVLPDGHETSSTGDETLADDPEPGV